LFHYSEGGANGNPRAHTDFAIGTPAQFRQQHDSNVTLNMPIDWDIELKQKDYAITLMQDQHQLVA
jgi:hypothetical protein